MVSNVHTCLNAGSNPACSKLKIRLPSSILSAMVPCSAATVPLIIRERSVEQSPATPVRRQRRWAPKVSTGCLTCRARRIKCDETKPACRRCTSIGRYCLGYSTNSQTLPQLNHQPVFSITPIGVHPTSQERQIFDLLRTLTVQEITGGYDRSFWATDVLQAAQTHPAIWHAGLAFAALHQRMKIIAGREAHRHFADNYYTFGVVQYNISIGHLIKLTQKQNLTYIEKQAVVLASTIHYGLCCLQKLIRQAMIHIQSALTLFYQWRLWEQAEKSPGSRRKGLLDPESLVRHVAYCYHDITSIDADRVSENLPAMIYRPVFSSRQPFTSTTEATFAYLPIRFNKYEQSPLGDEDSGMQRPTQDQISARHRALSIWKKRFQGFEESQNLAPNDLDCIALLRLHVAWDELFHNAVMDRRPESRAKLPPKWMRILDVAEQQLAKQSTSHGSSTPMYSFGLTPLDVVHMTGIVCRNRAIRRRAIEIQRKWPRSQGIWSSHVSALIIEVKLAFESAGMESPDCACVPDGQMVCEEHQAVGFKIDFETEGMVSITVKNPRLQREGLPGWVTTHLL